MKFDKDQILQLLKSQGDHDKAAQADSELPAEVDTDNPEHQNILDKFGLDPSSLLSKLGGGGGLGGLLGH